MVVESKHNGGFPPPGFESQIILILPAGGPGTRSIVSVPFHLYIVLACVENTFLAALLTIIIKKNDYVNLRILTSFSFFEQGDFS